MAYASTIKAGPLSALEILKLAKLYGKIADREFPESSSSLPVKRMWHSDATDFRDFLRQGDLQRLRLYIYNDRFPHGSHKYEAEDIIKVLSLLLNKSGKYLYDTSESYRDLIVDMNSLKNNPQLWEIASRILVRLDSPFSYGGFSPNPVEATSEAASTPPRSVAIVQPAPSLGPDFFRATLASYGDSGESLSDGVGFGFKPKPSYSTALRVVAGVITALAVTAAVAGAVAIAGHSLGGSLAVLPKLLNPLTIGTLHTSIAAALVAAGSFCATLGGIALGLMGGYRSQKAPSVPAAVPLTVVAELPVATALDATSPSSPPSLEPSSPIPIVSATPFARSISPTSSVGSNRSPTSRECLDEVASQLEF